jgi:hypothetical protein
MCGGVGGLIEVVEVLECRMHDVGNNGFWLVRKLVWVPRLFRRV